MAALQATQPAQRDGGGFLTGFSDSLITSAKTL